MGVGPGWSAVNTAAQSGTFSAFALGVADVGDQRLTLTSAIAIPAGVTAATLTFWHRFHFEFDLGGPNFDGGVLETSIDGGANWVDAGSLITANGYSGTIESGFGNPLAGREAWTGRNVDNPAFTEVIVDLSSFAGQSLTFRFRFGTDNEVAEGGWWIDDIVVTIGAGCATPTPTTPAEATPTEEPTPTTTETATPVPTETAMPVGDRYRDPDRDADRGADPDCDRNAGADGDRDPGCDRHRYADRDGRRHAHSDGDREARLRLRLQRRPRRRPPRRPRRRSKRRP